MPKKILIDETVVRQALDALEGRCGTNAEERLAGGAITALREALEVNNKGVNALAEQPDYSICPTCGGMASDPIVPVEARQQAPEPVAWQAEHQSGEWVTRETPTLPSTGIFTGRIRALYTHPAPTQQDGTNGVVALQERLRQEPVALQPLTAAQVLALYQKWGTGRLDGFTEAIREYEAALGIEGK